VDASKILNYPVEEELVNYTKPQQTDHSSAPLDELSPLRKLVGVWNCFLYEAPSSSFPCEGMFFMQLRAVGEGLRFTGEGTVQDGTDFTIDGDCHSLDNGTGDISVKYTRSFSTSSPPQYFLGTWEASSQCLTGTWQENDEPVENESDESEGCEEHGSSYFLVHRRTSQNDLCFLPPPSSFEANRTRALWRFALDAVRQRVRQKMWCWDFFRERRDNRVQFVDLSVRRKEYGKPLSEEEDDTFSRIQQNLTTPDLILYNSLVERQMRMTPSHK
jgi:hypothetical protein